MYSTRIDYLRSNQLGKHIEALQYIDTVRILNVGDVLKLFVAMPEVGAIG